MLFDKYVNCRVRSNGLITNMWREFHGLFFVYSRGEWDDFMQAFDLENFPVNSQSRPGVRRRSGGLFVVRGQPVRWREPSKNEKSPYPPAFYVDRPLRCPPKWLVFQFTKRIPEQKLQHPSSLRSLEISFAPQRVRFGYVIFRMNQN